MTVATRGELFTYRKNHLPTFDDLDLSLGEELYDLAHVTGWGPYDLCNVLMAKLSEILDLYSL